MWLMSYCLLFFFPPSFCFFYYFFSRQFKIGPSDSPEILNEPFLLNTSWEETALADLPLNSWLTLSCLQGRFPRMSSDDSLLESLFMMISSLGLRCRTTMHLPTEWFLWTPKNRILQMKALSINKDMNKFFRPEPCWVPLPVKMSLIAEHPVLLFVVHSSEIKNSCVQ